MVYAAYGLAVITALAGWFRPGLGFTGLLFLAAFTRELGPGPVIRRLAPFDLALAGLLAAWLWREWRAGRLRSALAPVRFFWPVLLFVAAALARIPWLPFPVPGLVETLVYAELVLAAALTWAVAEGRGPAVYRTFLLCMTLVAGLCAYEFSARLLHWPTLWEETIRIRGPFKNPNQAGSYLAMALPLTLGALAAPATVGLPRLALVGILGLQAVALLVTFSRTSMVSAAVAVLLYYTLLPAARRRAAGRRDWPSALAPVLLVGILAGVMATNAEVRDMVLWKLESAQVALRDLSDHDGSAGTFLAEIVGEGMAAWREHPYWGVGLGNFAYLNAEPGELMGYEIHGSYLSILTETGVIGALLMAVFLIQLLRRLWPALRARGSKLSPLLAGAMAGLASQMATGVWNAFLRKRHFWILVGLALVLAGHYWAGHNRRQGRRGPRPPEGVRLRTEPNPDRALRTLERARIPVANPYLSPAWLRAWRSHFGRRLTPVFVMVYRHRELIGYGAIGYRSWLGLRVYRFLGHGLANYLDPAARSGSEADVAGAVVSWFHRQPGPAVVLLHDLNSAAPAAVALARRLAETGAACDRHRLYPCPHVRLSEGFSAVAAAHDTRNRRRQMRRAMQRLVALGGHEFRLWARPEEAPELLALLPELRAVHRARFAGVINIRVRDDFWQFFAEVIPGMLGRGLEVLTLHVQGRLAGYEVITPMGNWYVAYACAFDPVFRSLSPGHLLDTWLMRSAAGRGYALFDFSKGTDTYKDRWQDGVSHNDLLVWWLWPGPAGRAARLAGRLILGGRLWLRHSGLTRWLRTLPGRVWRRAAPEPECFPWRPFSGLPLPRRFHAPVLRAVRHLPVPVQEAMVRLMAQEPGRWQVGLDHRGQRAYLRREDGEPYCIRWRGRG